MGQGTRKMRIGRARTWVAGQGYSPGQPVPECESGGTDDVCTCPAGLSKNLSRLCSSAVQAGAVKDYETDRLLPWLTSL